MTTTTVAALPHQRTVTQPLAAALRDVSLATPFYKLLLDNVNLAIRHGHVTTVLDQHDASASKVLDLLDGRVSPTWGSVLVADQELTELGHAELSRLKRDHIARAFPAQGIPQQLSVQQNLLVAQQQFERPIDLAWLDQVADLMQLHGTVGHVSAGGTDVLRARWAVARSLARKPTLVLVEDLTAGLTRIDELDLLNALRHAASKLNVAVVMATHDPVAASATDRVFRLRRGRLTDVTGEL